MVLLEITAGVKVGLLAFKWLMRKELKSQRHCILGVAREKVAYMVVYESLTPWRLPAGYRSAEQ